MRIILQMPLVSILGSISFFFQPFSAPTQNSKFIILQKYQIFIAQGNLPPFYKFNISCVTSFLQISDGKFSCFSDHQHHWCLIQLQLLNHSRKGKKRFYFDMKDLFWMIMIWFFRPELKFEIFFPPLLDTVNVWSLLMLFS